MHYIWLTQNLNTIGNRTNRSMCNACFFTIAQQERKREQLLLLTGATKDFPELTPPENIEGRVSESQCLSWSWGDSTSELVTWCMKKHAIFKKHISCTKYDIRLYSISLNKHRTQYPRGYFRMVGWTWPAPDSLLRTWVVKPPTEVLKKLKPEDKPCNVGVILRGQFYIYKADPVTVESVNSAKGTAFKVGYYSGHLVLSTKQFHLYAVCCWTR